MRVKSFAFDSPPGAEDTMTKMFYEESEIHREPIGFICDLRHPKNMAEDERMLDKVFKQLAGGGRKVHIFPDATIINEHPLWCALITAGGDRDKRHQLYAYKLGAQAKDFLSLDDLEAEIRLANEYQDYKHDSDFLFQRASEFVDCIKELQLAPHLDDTDNEYLKKAQKRANELIIKAEALVKKDDQNILERLLQTRIVGEKHAQKPKDLATKHPILTRIRKKLKKKIRFLMGK